MPPQRVISASPDAASALQAAPPRAPSSERTPSLRTSAAARLRGRLAALAAARDRTERLAALYDNQAPAPAFAASPFKPKAPELHPRAPAPWWALRARATPPLPIAPRPAVGPALPDNGKYRLPFATQEWPRVSDGFGAPRHYGSHRGIDFPKPQGTEVFASRPGTVVFIDDHYSWALMKKGRGRRGQGNRVIVEHADGSETWYAHLAPGSIRVRLGERVTPATVLGEVGSTGYSTAPHLHFGVYDASGRARNPAVALGHVPERPHPSRPKARKAGHRRKRRHPSTLVKA